MKNAGMLIIGSLIAITSIAGCSTQINSQAGQALNQSFNLIRPSAELGISVRAADPSLTIEEFLTASGVTQLTEQEALFITGTLDEHQETIDALVNPSSVAGDN